MGDKPDDTQGHRGRLRERLLQGGGDTLLDHELVEYLLTTGLPRVDTKKKAKELLATYGGIGRLLGTPPEVLLREGLSEPVVGALAIARATAERLLETKMEERPVLSSWDALGDYLHATMAHELVEQVRVLFLNGKNMLLSNEAMWRGSVDEAAVHVREVMARAITLGASAIIIVHNHPSGDPTPSQADIRLTRDLVDAGRHMKVTVHDHVIVGARGRVSLRAQGLL
ncbi:DNA repair protein RadC [Sphingomonas sp. BN140010]|uniref:DNA repair protein RadC n=1 Tax=Sphingomonas arvum TaxID=2992113 RepID=A0ABT3JCM9_9SPHN|nr:DNA repair protein RadC [Sphingomonas sp. BN140010]MCW3796838.1 DNA repair protein RadC [Sphingomonas sp. BN140010]